MEHQETTGFCFILLHDEGEARNTRSNLQERDFYWIFLFLFLFTKITLNHLQLAKRSKKDTIKWILWTKASKHLINKLLHIYQKKQKDPIRYVIIAICPRLLTKGHNHQSIEGIDWYFHCLPLRMYHMFGDWYVNCPVTCDLSCILCEPKTTATVDADVKQDDQMQYNFLQIPFQELGLHNIVFFEENMTRTSFTFVQSIQL